VSEQILDASTATRSTSLLALARVAQTFGLDLDPNQLARAHPFDGAEPSPALLRQIAERVGLTASPMRIKRGELARLEARMPAIMLLDDGSCALLAKISRTGAACFALIEDLHSTEKWSALVDEPRLLEHWTGDLLLLRRSWSITDENQPFGYKWFVGQVLSEKRSVRDVCIAAFTLGLLALAPPITFILLLDRVLTNRSFDTLGVLGGAMVIITVFDTMFGYLRRKMVLLVAARIDGRINLHIFDRLLNLPMSFFERTPTGLINSQIGQVWHIRHFLTGQVLGTMIDGIILFVLLPVLFAINWKLALLVIALALLILGVYALYIPKLREKHSAVIEAEQRMNSHQTETIYGIRTIKSLSLEGLRRYQRDLHVARTVETHLEFDRLANVPQTIVTPLERLIYSGSFFVGCYMALNDPTGATAGVIVAFAMLAGRVTAPIVQMAGLLNSFEEARGAMGQLAKVMNVPPEEGRSGAGLKLPISGAISFQEVRFRYSPASSYALDGVSFNVPAGSIFGVMGRSGSGKTTVTRLLQGMNRDYEGLIKIDGMDLREMDLDHLRSSIGVVPQENFLFSGTVRENIGAGRPNAGFSLIARVAQLAGAAEFIERLPQGYDTPVEEGAVNFSGGQRQRLAIARALLLDPPILILDEATSALDAESEAIVNSNLMRIAQNRTVIIISHRLSSLMTADAILVLERGRYYDLGVHEELLARCDIYQSLWHQQNRHLDPSFRHARRLRTLTPPAA
jgi:ATP-binding cassette subfamily B protein